MNFADNDQFLKVIEIAAYLRCSTQTVRRLIHDDKLTAVRVGRNFRVSVKSADEYLRTHSTERKENH